MKVFSLAMCDDNSRALTAFSNAMENIFAECGAKAVIDTFSSSKALESRLKAKRYDAVFLDIEMPVIDGITLGKNLRRVKDATHIIYLSGKEERVFETFETHPFGFIRKSNFLKDGTEIVKSFISTSGRKNEIIEIKTHTNDIVSINPASVVYIENIKDCQNFFFSEKTQPLKLKSTMDRLEDQLSPYGFIRIHQGYIVNYLSILRIDNTVVTLTNGASVPISRRKLRETRIKFMQLTRKDGVKHIS